MKTWPLIAVSVVSAVSAIVLWGSLVSGYKGCSRVSRNGDTHVASTRTGASSPSDRADIPSNQPVAPKPPVPTNASCIFCNIFAGTKSARKYAQDADNLLFQSLSGGVLAIPKAHIESLKQLDTSNVDVVASMILFAAQKSRELPEFKDKQYQRAYFHTGRRAGQTVFHLHMHLWFRGATHACGAMTGTSGFKTLANSQHATLMQENGSKTLYVQFKRPLGHLGSFDAISSKELARGLLLASEYIRNHFPNSDYATDIDNVCDSAGNKTVEIAIRLR